MTKYGRAWAASCIAVYLLCLFTLGYEINLVGPSIGDIAAKLHVEETSLSPLYTISGLWTFLGAIPAGWLIDKYPGHTVVGLAVLSQAIGLWFIPYCQTLWQLMIVYAVPASTFNFINIGGNTMAAWVKPKNASPYLNLIGSGFGIGSFFAPALAFQCKQLFGDALLAFQITAALALTVSVALLCIPSPPHGGVGRTSLPEDEAPTLTADSSFASYSDLTKALVSAEDVAREPPKSVLSRPTRLAIDEALAPKVSWHVASACAVLVMFNIGTSTGVGAWVHTWALREAHLSLEAATTANSVFWGAFAIGRVVSAVVSTMVQPIAIIIPSLSISGLGLLALSVAPELCYQYVPLLYATIFCIGFGTAPVFSNGFALLARYSGVTGAANSLISGATGIGIMTIPAFLAFAVNSTALNPEPGTYKVVMTICLFLVLLQIGLAIWAELAGRVAYARAVQEELGGADVDTFDMLSTPGPDFAASDPDVSLLDLADAPTPAVNMPMGRAWRATTTFGRSSMMTGYVQRSSLTSGYVPSIIGASPSTLLSINGETPQAVQVMAAKVGSLY